MRLPLSPSLLPFLNDNTKKKQQKRVTTSFLKENKCMSGWKLQKPTKLDGNDTTTHTFTPSLHLVPFCQLCTPQNSLHALNLFHMQLQHTTQAQHCSSTAQFLHTVKTDHICHAQYSNYIAATHNITHSPCTLKRTTHSPLPTPLQKHKAYLCKWWQNGTRCRDGVKVLYTVASSVQSRLSYLL